MSVQFPNGDNIEYLIDGQNRRIGKKVNGVIVKKWIYSGQLSPIAELDSAGNVIAQFVGSIMIKDGNTYQLITDYIGSVRIVVDVNTGDIAQKINYDEFGNIINDNNPDFQPFAYASGLYDNQSKLTRFGARDYEASIGRWTAKDPIGFASLDMNLYGYVIDDPINNIDSDGNGPGTAAARIAGKASHFGELFFPHECNVGAAKTTPSEQKEAYENWINGRTANLDSPPPPTGSNPFPVKPDKTKTPINPPPPPQTPPRPGSLPPH